MKIYIDFHGIQNIQMKDLTKYDDYNYDAFHDELDRFLANLAIPSFHS